MRFLDLQTSLRPGALISLLAALFFCAGIPNQPGAPGGVAFAQQDDGAEESDWAVGGRVAPTFVLRSASVTDGKYRYEAEDQDLLVRVRLEITQPKRQQFAFHFLGTVKQDLDGITPSTGFTPLEGLGEVGTEAVRAFVYEASFDWNHPVALISQLRMGRQNGTRGEPIVYDGATAEMALSSSLTGTVYGGYAVHRFEYGATPGDDTLAGWGVDWQPGRPTRLSVDFLSTQDRREPLTNQKPAQVTDRNDQLLALDWRQRFSDTWRGGLRARFINGEGRDMRLRLLRGSSAGDWTFSAAYFRQLREQNELSTDLSTYYDVLGASQPYQSLDLRTRWSLSADTALDAGLYWRDLLADTPTGPFNRDFSRVFAVLDTDHVIAPPVSLAVTLEHWGTGTTSVATGGLDATYRFGAGREAARVRAGSNFSLFKYDDYIALGERSHVRTLYVDGRLPLLAGLTLSGGYEHELADEDIFQTFKAGIRYDF